MINFDLDHFRARVLQDALTEATAQYWIHRAHQLRQAAPRPGEYHGQSTHDQLTEAWYRCEAAAMACLRHAELLRSGYPEPISDEVWEALGEVA